MRISFPTVSVIGSSEDIADAQRHIIGTGFVELAAVGSTTSCCSGTGRCSAHVDQEMAQQHHARTHRIGERRTIRPEIQQVPPDFCLQLFITVKTGPA